MHRLQGEDQKKLDVVSNEVFKNCLASCGRTVRPQQVTPQAPYTAWRA